MFNWLFGKSNSFPDNVVPKVNREEPWPNHNEAPVSLDDAIEALRLCYRALSTGVGKNKAKNVASRVLVRAERNKFKNKSG